MQSEASATRIWMLHRVLEDRPAAFGLPSCYRMRGTALTLGELGRALDAVGPVLPLDAVELALSCGEAPPPGTVLTFDDGYREHLDVVAPLLAERGVTATFYVATGLHGAGTDVALVDAWYWLLDHAIERVAKVLLPAGGRHQGRIDSVEAKGAWVGGEPKAALLAAPPQQQTAMLDALADSVGCSLPADLAARLYLCPSEWSSLVRLGMRVGAHSVSHPRMTQMDELQLDSEAQESVEAVRTLGTPVPFAYPDGAYDERVVRAVRRAGVSSAVTCAPGVVRCGTDLLRLPRVFVTPGAQVGP